MHTILVILLGNYFSDLLQLIFNVTIFTGAAFNKFATGLRSYGCATTCRIKNKNKTYFIH